MNILRLAPASIGDVKTGHNIDHHLAQGSEAGIIDKIIIAAKSKIEEYKAQARNERDTEQVLLMDDSMLKDIGLSPTDNDSLKSGLISLGDLNARKETYPRQFN